MLKQEKKRHSPLEIVMSDTVPSWKRLLARRLPALGHRNWIGIVDAAYPLQTGTGIETVVTGTAYLVVLKEVLNSVRRASHVRPRIIHDAELSLLSETLAPGVGILREKLVKLLAEDAASSLPHEEIIGKLDAAAKLFHILIFKTTMTLPYTSVFLELDCGYWSDDAERALRTSHS